MKETAIYVALGALTAGLVAGGVVLYQRKQPVTVKAITPATKPALDYNAAPPGTQPNQPTQAQTDAATIAAQQAAAKAAADAEAARQAAIVRAELERQAAAEAAQKRQQDIERLILTARDVENKQVLNLVQIKAIQADQSRLNDFTQQAITEMMSGQAWLDRVNACKKIVDQNCGWWDLVGACHGDGNSHCESRTPDPIWGNPAAAVYNEAQDPNNPKGGWARMKREQLNRQQPFEADLLRLEAQYKGIQQQLKTQYGVDLTASNAEVHAYTPKA